MLLAKNMIHLMRRIRVALMKEAVLTAMAGSFCHETADGFRYRHRIDWRRARALAMIMRCSSCRKSSSSARSA